MKISSAPHLVEAHRLKPHMSRTRGARARKGGGGRDEGQQRRGLEGEGRERVYNKYLVPGTRYQVGVCPREKSEERRESFFLFPALGEKRRQERKGKASS